MAKKQAPVAKPVAKKRKNLPKSRNGVKRQGAGFAAYGYQKDSLRAEARRLNVSVSYLINMKLWKDWL